MRDSDWLAGLKPGDEVGVLYTNWGSYRVAQVRENSRRHILLSDCISYSPLTGESTGAVIVPLTEVPPQTIMLDRIEHVRWRNLPLATLERIVAALEANDER